MLDCCLILETGKSQQNYGVKVFLKVRQTTDHSSIDVPVKSFDKLGKAIFSGLNAAAGIVQI